MMIVLDLVLSVALGAVGGALPVWLFYEWKDRRHRREALRRFDAQVARLDKAWARLLEKQ